MSITSRQWRSIRTFLNPFHAEERSWVSPLLVDECVARLESHREQPISLAWLNGEVKDPPDPLSGWATPTGFEVWRPLYARGLDPFVARGVFVPQAEGTWIHLRVGMPGTIRGPWPFIG